MSRSIATAIDWCRSRPDHERAAINDSWLRIRREIINAAATGNRRKWLSVTEVESALVGIRTVYLEALAAGRRIEEAESAAIEAATWIK